MSWAEKANLSCKALVQELLNGSGEWVVGFSGGKDSTAALALMYHTLLMTPNLKKRRMRVVYCDTGVEIPVVARYVRRALRSVQRRADQDGLRMEFRSAQPRLNDRFLVKVLGRGYPPPSLMFRWCTDRLRIDPVARVIREIGSERATVLLGTRFGESSARDRTLAEYSGGSFYEKRQVGSDRTRLYCPIIDFTTEDVWGLIETHGERIGIDVNALSTLYADAGGDCPLVRQRLGAPCSKGRFGCWTCTVVARDRSSMNLVDAGYDKLEPLLAWRQLLITTSSDPGNRAKYRRNGKVGPGPLTLEARRQLLRALRRAECESGYRLVRKDELKQIRRWIRRDVGDAEYRE